MVKRFPHVSVLHLLVRLHCCSCICILIFHYPLNVLTGMDLSDLSGPPHHSLHNSRTRGSRTLKDLSKVTGPVRDRGSHPPDSHTQLSVYSTTLFWSPHPKNTSSDTHYREINESAS